jgi:hypothetical protein
LRFDDIVPATALATVPEAIFSAVGTILLLSTVAPSHVTVYRCRRPLKSADPNPARLGKREWQWHTVAAEEGGGERWVVAGRRRARKRTEERMLRRRVCAAENKGPCPFLLCFLEKEIKTEREETSAV